MNIEVEIKIEIDNFEEIKLTILEEEKPVWKRPNRRINSAGSGERHNFGMFCGRPCPENKSGDSTMVT